VIFRKKFTCILIQANLHEKKMLLTYVIKVEIVRDDVKMLLTYVLTRSKWRSFVVMCRQPS